MAHPTRILPMLLGLWSWPSLAVEGVSSEWSWRSADEPSGALQFWADLPNTGGTNLGLSTGGSATVTLPFTMELLGSTISAVTVYSDGLVTPATASGPGTYASGRCIGDGSTSGAAIAPLWGSWDLSSSGSVYAKTWNNGSGGGGILVEWRDLKTRSSESSAVDFAVLIRSEGDISFSYLDSSTGSSSTSQGQGAAIGVQAASGDGATISCDESILNGANDAITVSPLGMRHLAGDMPADEIASTWILGESANDQFGKSLTTIGDLDGDGRTDFAVGAPQSDGGGSNAGAVYLFGGEISDHDSVGTSDAWTTILGSQSADQAGWTLDGRGDLDGDGKHDLLIGVPYEDSMASNAGAVSIFFGNTLLSQNAFEIDDADLLLWGDNTNDTSGSALAWAGDVNGDGYADLVVGAPGEDTGGSSAGMTYLILGGASPVDLALGNADAQYYGEATADASGSAVLGIGDADGDGYDDFAIGAYGQDDAGTNAGAVYVIYGDNGISGSHDLGGEDRITGANASDSAGYSLGRAGDLDNDGLADFLVGSPTADSQSGAATALLGDAWPSRLDSGWIRMNGGSSQRLGASLGTLDLSNDNDPAVVTGNYGDSAGAALGGSVTFFDVASTAASDVDGEEDQWGRIIGVESTGYLGHSLAIGDINGDGFDDVLGGAYGADGDESASGAVLFVHARTTWPDADGDGFMPHAWGGIDCDDQDATLSPSTEDICDGIDNDCDGVIDNDEPDTDGDGIADCIDTEECDGLDNDGDGFTDEGMSDSDGDGLCDSIDTEECDGLDNDGDGEIDEDYSDSDRDGIADCMDVEECDGLDNDGDGAFDEGYGDTDGDGIADCIDTEGCDGLDNDGDGEIDEDFADTDGDGTPDCLDEEICDGIDNDGDGTVDEDLSDLDEDGLCDELDSEDCDGIDNDGDGEIDEDFEDADGDGLADCQDGEECDGLDNDGDGFIDEGYADSDSDGVANCVDVEECDGFDNDGDGLVDEIFGDSDYDGIADCMDVEECDGLDNDGDGLIDPDEPDTDSDGAADCIDVESCDGLDNDGDGSIDEGFSDMDGNGTADCVDISGGDASEATGELGTSSCSTTRKWPAGGHWLVLMMMFIRNRRRAD